MQRTEDLADAGASPLGPAPEPAGATCPACGASDPGESRSVPDHEYGLAHRARYTRCRACGSEFQTPMPDLAVLASWYPRAYHSMGGGGRLLEIRHDLRLRRLERLLDGEGALLDYGCGDGSFLVHASRRLGPRPLFGYEIADRAERKELAGGAVTLIRGSFADLLAALPPCRLVAMNHVVEHLPDPLEVVGALADRLLPGGLFEGQTPAAGSLEQRLLGARWSGYHAPRHTVVFSPAGLRRLCERAGLTDVSVRGAFNPAGLALSLGSIAHGDAPGVIPRQGLRWLALLGLGAALAPVDLLSGAPAVVDFSARKPGPR
jgi:SAM-dependent methyltransferase